LIEWLQGLASLPLAGFLRDVTPAYATLNAAHILAIGLIVGSIATLDLRVLGLFEQTPLGALAPPLSRIAAAGVLLAAVTGFLLFSVRPVAYAENPAFLTKIGLVGAGVVNALVLRANSHWQLGCQGGPLHVSVRLMAVVSLSIWAAGGPRRALDRLRGMN
jgi:hypothetical protein